MNVLLIGGPGDGWRYDVSDDLPYIRFASPAQPIYEQIKDPLSIVPEITHYNIVKFAGQYEVFHLGVPSDMPVDFAVQMLLDGYRK